jgi:hypothetical protein
MTTKPPGFLRWSGPWELDRSFDVGGVALKGRWCRWYESIGPENPGSLLWGPFVYGRR